MSGVPIAPIATRATGNGSLNDVNSDASLDFPSNDDEIDKKLANFNVFMDRGLAEKQMLRDNFLGFLTQSFQGTIQSVTPVISVAAESYYVNKDNITFLVNPGAAHYNPSLIQLKLPIKFTNSDGN